MPPSNPAAVDPPRFSEDIDSTCSTPFVSAPSSPGHGPSGYFFSAPASPMHFLLTTQNSSAADYEAVFLSSDSASYEFEFSSRFSPNGFGATSSMTSADELFFNGQIRPMKLSSHLATPLDGFPPPLMDLAGVETGASSRGRDLRLRSANSKFANRRARSMSPMRFGHWRRSRGLDLQSAAAVERVNEETENESGETTPSCSASSSSSRSSSSGRNSKKWIFLKDLLNRSKSEGRGSNKEISFWSAISLSPAKEKKPPPLESSTPVLSPSSSRDDKMKKERKAPAASRKAANGVGRRRSAHEAHYTAKRAQAAEMKKKTYLPYRQGVLGCLGFSSKSYSAFSGFTRNLNPISSRTTSTESDWNFQIIFLSSVAAACLPLLPFRRDGGGWIPSAHDSFSVSTMIAFSCAFSSLFLNEKPKAARIFRLSAIIWMSAAILLLLHALLSSF